MAQVVLQVEAVARPRVHVGVEHLVTRFAARLGVVHRRVGVPHDLVGIAVLAGAEGDADARRREHLAARDHNRFAQRFLNAEGDDVCLLLVADRLQQNRELVAAEARQRVSVAQARLEAARHRDQHFVADEMAKAVVHHLEAVEVEIENRESSAAAMRPLEFLEPASEPVHEIRAIAQARQRIAEARAAKLLLCERVIGRIGQRSCNARRRFGLFRALRYRGRGTIGTYRLHA